MLTIFISIAVEHDAHNESDVQILEPHISVLNLDEYEEKELPAPDEISAVKIKQEPKYEGYADEDEDDAFEDVGTIEADPIDLLDDGSGKLIFGCCIFPHTIINQFLILTLTTNTLFDFVAFVLPKPDEFVPATAVHTQPTMVASMDGNVELQDSQPTTIGTNKIKINISKNVQLNKNSINSSETVDPNVAIDSNKESDASDACNTECIADSRTIIANNTDGCGDGESVTTDVPKTAATAPSTAQTTKATASQPDNNGDSSETASAAQDDGAHDGNGIEYEVKESIRHVRFKRQLPVRSGLEASGLCSIM